MRPAPSSLHSAISRRGAALLFPLFLLLACGKKEEPAPPPPELATPGAVEAQAEVKASSGPVELTLRLHKTQLKLGDSIWHQIRLRNVGMQELITHDQVFHDPWQLRDNAPVQFPWDKAISREGLGIYIEVRGPDGRLAQGPIYVDDHPDVSGQVSGMLEVEGPEEQAMLEGWKKQGLSLREINQKLVDFNMAKRRAAEIEVERPYIRLQPGESAETKSWFYYSDWERKRKKPVPKPIGDFQELQSVELREPGKYKVRAGYNYRISKKDELEYRKMGMSSYDCVFVLTPWIEVTVLP